MEAFLIKLQAIRIVTLLNRDSWEICRIFKNTLFYWTSLVAVSDSFRFPTCNFIIKRFPQRCFSVNFAKFLRTCFDRTSPDDCISGLSVNFKKSFRTSLLWSTSENCFFHVQVAEFQPADTDAVKNYFTGAFQAFYTRVRSSHLKALIYLKSLKIICEEVIS